MKAGTPFDLIVPSEMAKVADEAGINKATRHPFTPFFPAVTAGIFIAIAFTFYITATIGSAAVPWGAKLVGGICFSLGLIRAVLRGADLFTPPS